MLLYFKFYGTQGPGRVRDFKVYNGALWDFLPSCHGS